MKLPPLGVAMAAITKNEGPFIAEWVAYHYLLGVEHFFIYDNGSSDTTAAELTPFVNCGIVTLIHWPLFPGQIEAYQHALAVLGPNCDWMGFLDIDEFVALPAELSLPAFLGAQSPDTDEVVLFWRMYGHSGHHARPAGLTIQNFTRCDPAIWQISKCFVRPDRVRLMHIHHAETVNRTSVDELGRPVRQVWMHERDAPTAQRVAVNHYFTRSYDDYRAKIARGQADGRSEKKLEPFEKWDFRHVDDRIARMGPAVARLLDIVRDRGRQPMRYGNLTRFGVTGSDRNFVVASQSAVKAHLGALEALGVTGRLQHTNHGTAITTPDAPGDPLPLEALDRMCRAVPSAGRLMLPENPAAPAALDPSGLAMPEDIVGTVWAAAIIDVQARGWVEFAASGHLRDGRSVTQRRRQSLPETGRVLTLMTVTAEPFIPTAFTTLSSDPSAVQVRECRVFAAH